MYQPLTKRRKKEKQRKRESRFYMFQPISFISSFFHFGRDFLRMLTWHFRTFVFSLYKMVNGQLVIQTEEFWLESVRIIYVSLNKFHTFCFGLTDKTDYKMLLLHIFLSGWPADDQQTMLCSEWSSLILFFNFFFIFLFFFGQTISRRCCGGSAPA